MGLCPFLTHYPQLSSNFHFLGQYFLTSPAYSVDINVSLHDFLRGNHGLWQRNPLGPYLFRLAIRIVSHNLNKAAEDGIISYHPKMQGLKTYTFVLLIIYLFSHMAPSLPWLVLSQYSLNFRCFQALPSALRNPASSKLVFQPRRSPHCLLIGYFPGFLPIKYHLLPLTLKSSQSLTASPCSKIEAKMGNSQQSGFVCWKKLSYFGILNFWCASFVIPKEFISQMNYLCDSLLEGVNWRKSPMLLWKR